MSRGEQRSRYNVLPQVQTGLLTQTNSEGYLAESKWQYHEPSIQCISKKSCSIKSRESNLDTKLSGYF